jgi:spore germination cell wall hydrolase CwlJ-like protein
MMRGVVTAGLLAISVVVGARAQGGGSAGAEAPIPTQSPKTDWSAWTRPLAPAAGASARSEADPGATAPAAEPEIDVVDARWMALTMWGEARGGGEAAMRAVGHVIDNRRRAGLQSRYVTDTVSEAFQFSCWNAGDPNREAMMNVDSLRPDSEDHLMWLTAKRVAEEILSGRSEDPTGGALFYHTTAVSPRWSIGMMPTRQIGSHLFFRAARRA